MTRYLFMAVAAFVLGSLLGVIALQDSAIERLETEGRDKDRQIGAIRAANLALESALAAARENARRTDELLADNAEKNQTLTTQARRLERRLREAMHDATTIDLDAPLPGDATLALCLRWRAASGLAADDSRSPAFGPAAGAGDSLAGIGGGVGSDVSSLCDAWRGVSMRDVLEWSGTLLDHAGAERLDKAALRQWAAGVQ